ncbi:benzoate/H(+) symporter BenE family transporter [Xinfangfangia sp. D13-10-4-6]|uniref:benzoate/H(+) symporter BenE family transporter n=1 Tax=Pseudogemmobacter hezensis TaxID=2737662 RepID=UPI0015580CCA|nr:benzoate/H(+) symporter BenE family transporter [Pseudogemmobacter hezensis]NPD16452.1 benzoate/H(+) symporter BenE family transporter [Pseudogemmobacter hezensis]
MFPAALVAALIGFGSSIAIVLSAAAAVGASPAQTTSWILMLCMAKAAGSAYLSWRHRVPVVLAWSTPGAALIAASSGVNMAEAAGAFILAGLLVALTAVLKPLARLIRAIPDGIAGAMLAGVLLPFCMAGAKSAAASPELVLPMVLVFALVRLFNAPLAVLAALATGIVAATLSGAAEWHSITVSLPVPVFVAPAFSPGVMIGLAVPLYLVNMASQNLPGFATMRAAGYEPPVQNALAVTGGISMLAGLFGAHSTTMAAITAAICMGPDVDPDAARRWRVGLVYAVIWVFLGLMSPVILGLLAMLPAAVMAGLVALALLSPLTGALTTACAAPDQRFAAILTVAVSASGMAAFGIGAAFWGLLAGIVFYGLERLHKARQR